MSGPDEAPAAFESAQREGQAYFADPTVYVERYLEDPRHVEVQVLADAHGNVIHLGERECTIQRRHQKLVEETPSPAVDDALRARIGAIAVDAARAAGYRSAGTIEGLLSQDGEYYFLEMNTRIQVEHTVTELVTGLDLVREQVLIAAGEPLPLRQEDVSLRGHAIECRINAEDPSTGFLPAPGRITSYREPAGPGVRVDSGVEAGTEVPPFYDPLLAKLVVHGVDREHARRRMLRALDEYEIGGVETLLGFHRALLSEPCFVEAGTCAGIVESRSWRRRRAVVSSDNDGSGSPDGAVRAAVVPVELDGRRFEVRVAARGASTRRARTRDRDRGPGHGLGAGGARRHRQPDAGTVLRVRVAEGDEVAAGDVVCIVEAMKMENEIAAHRPGTVTALSVAAGESVTLGQVICVVEGGEVAPPRRFCSDVSREHGEPLAATASRVDRWILIEHHGAWGKDAVDSSGLSAEVKAHLAECAAATRPAKVLFIRRRERRAADGIHVYWGSSAPRAPVAVVDGRRGLRDLLGSGLRRTRRRAGPSVAARLHAREARRLLREVRPTGLRGDAGLRRRRVALAVLARGRRPVRGQRRLPARGRVLRTRRCRGCPGVDRGSPRRTGPSRPLSRAVLLLVPCAGG